MFNSENMQVFEGHEHYTVKNISKFSYYVLANFPKSLGRIDFLTESGNIS